MAEGLPSAVFGPTTLFAGRRVLSRLVAQGPRVSLAVVLWASSFTVNLGTTGGLAKPAWRRSSAAVINAFGEKRIEARLVGIGLDGEIMINWFSNLRLRKLVCR